MNTLDVIAFAFLIFGAIRGFIKGFFYEAASLIALVAGVFLAVLLANVVGTITESLTTWNVNAVRITVFIIVFILVVVSVRLFGKVLTKILKAIHLNFLNRIAGLFFGMIKWAFLLAVTIAVLEFLDKGKRVITESLMDNSLLYPLLDRFNFLV